MVRCRNQSKSYLSVFALLYFIAIDNRLVYDLLGGVMIIVCLWSAVCMFCLKWPTKYLTHPLHFAGNLFKCIFVNEFRMSILILQTFVPKGLLNNKSALVQVMSWRRTADKPLPEPMLTQFTDAYMYTRGRWDKNCSLCRSKHRHIERCIEHLRSKTS